MGRSNRNQHRIDDIGELKELIDATLAAVKELLAWKVTDGIVESDLPDGAGSCD